MIRGVLFDLYGTLLVYGDMTAAWAAWLEQLHVCCIAAGSSITIEELAEKCDGFFTREEPESPSHGLTVYERRIEELCDAIGITMSHEQLRAAADSTATSWQAYAPLDPHALRVLPRLKRDFKLALVTNFDHPPFVTDLLRRHHLDSYFDAVTISGDVGIKKPSHAIFRIALEKLGLDNSEVLHVGDSKDDVVGALAAGIKPVQILREGAEETVASDFRVESMDEHYSISTNRDIQRIEELPQIVDILDTMPRK
jgi:HAD superfamily hydrolase (TIGR01549 family)